MSIEIVNKSQCCGCSACYNVCPKKCIFMKKDVEGFLYPEILSDACIACNFCENVCPVANKGDISFNENKVIAVAAVNKNDTIRKKSSSGGIFSIIAENIIENSGVVYGAAYQNQFEEVVHKRIDKIENIVELYGSKYLQSDIDFSYSSVQKDLDNGRKVLFSGTPCQIEGLKKFLKKDYANLLCIDIICHGVPSPKVWESYIRELKEKYQSEVSNVNFRDKSSGWKNFSLRICFKSNNDYVNVHNMDPYMQVFLRNYILRPSCYDCAFKTVNRASDLTIADFWGIERINKSIDDDKGISLVLIQSEKGKKVLYELSKNCILENVNLEDSIAENCAIKKSVAVPKDRNKFFCNFYKGGFSAGYEILKKADKRKRYKNKIISVLKRF